MSDLTLAHSQHLASALTQIMDARWVKPTSETTKQMSLSLCSEAIAQSLADAQHISVDAEPRPMRELIASQREWFRDRAERAIESLDPACYDDAKEATVATMLNGAFRRPMDTEELIRETLAVFQAEMASPRVGRR